MLTAVAAKQSLGWMCPLMMEPRGLPPTWSQFRRGGTGPLCLCVCMYVHYFCMMPCMEFIFRAKTCLTFCVHESVAEVLHAPNCPQHHTNLLSSSHEDCHTGRGHGHFGVLLSLYLRARRKGMSSLYAKLWTLHATHSQRKPRESGI